MSFLNIECPHCLTPKAPLSSVAFAPQPNSENRCFGFFMCLICSKPTSAWLTRERSVPGASMFHELNNFPRTVQDGGWVIVSLWPEPRKSAAPEDVPQQIARNYVQAQEAATRQHWEAAGMAFRRVLELTLKDKGPNLTGTLAKRIDKLVEDGKLTPDIAEWSHSIRVLGNEAAHDEGEPTPDDVMDMAAFTRVILEYLYTMPAKVMRRASPAETATPA